jgi:hypothetical protein
MSRVRGGRFLAAERVDHVHLKVNLVNWPK